MTNTLMGPALYDAGFTQLVCVMPPNAELSPGSRIKEKSRGKAPGKKGANGWHGYSFTTAPLPGREDVEQWARDGANIGVLGRYYPGLDIDSSDEVLTAVVERIAQRELGAAPLRLSVSPRALLMYRTDEPFTRMALLITYKGETHVVEMLGDGRQYLVAGEHPSGEQYRWEEGRALLADYPEPFTLTTITRDDVARFFDALEAGLRDRGIEVERVGDGSNPEDRAPAQDALIAPSAEALMEVVAALPNDGHFDERDDFVRVAHAIAGAAGDDTALGLDAFAAWAQSWTNGTNDPDEIEVLYNGLKPPFRLGYDWLVEQASRLTGYNDAALVFTADTDAEPEAPQRAISLPGQLDFTDVWAAHQILPYVQDRLLWDAKTERWLLWDGTKWSSEDETRAGVVIEDELRTLALLLEDRAARMSPASAGKPLLAAAKKYQNLSGIVAVTRLLQPHLSVKPDAFDCDPFALNTPAGLVDLRTGEIAPSSPALMVARCTAVAPKEGSLTLWMKFLHDLTGGDEELILFLQRSLGYSLTGDMREKVLQMCHGADSDTGKSTYVRTVVGVMGMYAESIDVDSFVGGRGGGGIPADLAKLPGVRLVTATEPSAGHKWDEKRIKAITGGDEINARFLYGNWFTYRPQFKILIVGNHEPEIRATDSAMLRRITVVPFDRPVPRDKQVANLSDILIEREGPAILQWMIEGTRMWLAEGLNPPTSVQVSTKEYSSDEDTLQQWIDEELIFAPEADCSRQELYDAWSIWCRRRGEEPGGFKSLKRRLAPKFRGRTEEAQVGNARHKGYRGVSVRSGLSEVDSGDA